MMRDEMNRETELEEIRRIAAEIESDEQLSHILSVEAVEESRDRIHDALINTIVANGHGVLIESTAPPSRP